MRAEWQQSACPYHLRVIILPFAIVFLDLGRRPSLKALLRLLLAHLEYLKGYLGKESVNPLLAGTSNRSGQQISNNRVLDPANNNCILFWFAHREP